MVDDTTFPAVKRCKTCNETKPREMFSKGKDKDGLQHQCKACVKIYNQANRARDIARKSQYRESMRSRDYIEPISEKKCGSCHQIKPSSAFSKNKLSLDGYQHYCKACTQTPNGRAQALDRASWPDNHKRCPRCKEIKPFEDFGRHKNRSDGLSSWCNRCNSQHACDWAKSNPDKHNAQSRKWRMQNREKRLKTLRAYAASYPDRVKASARKHYRNNREQKAEWQRAYNKANPHKRNAITARRRARLAGVGGRGITAADIQAMIYCQMGLCAYCERDGQKLTLDHIIPIDQGGPHDPDNCCMACGVCNSSKGNRTPEEWEKAGRWFDCH